MAMSDDVAPSRKQRAIPTKGYTTIAIFNTLPAQGEGHSNWRSSEKNLAKIGTYLRVAAAWGTS